MWNEDDRKWLYEKMKGAGINTGSYADFSASMDNDEDRDWYFKKAQSMGLNIGSASDFAAMMSTPKQQTPVVEQPQQVQTPAAAAPAPLTSAQARPQSGAYTPNNDPILQQMKKDGKIKPAIPSLSDVAEQTAFKPTLLFESEQTVDANGNIVSKPKPVPTFKNGRMGMGYHDMFTGEYYDINDPASESIVKNYTRTYESMKDLAAINRQQVGNMTKSIDDMLRNAGKKQLEEGSPAVKTLTDKDANWFQKLGAAMAMGNQGNVLDNHNAVTANQMANAPSVEVQQLTAAKRSMRDAQRMIAEADKAVKEGNFDGFFKGAGRGFGNKLFDADTWDMGASDASDAINLYSILQKADKGEKLTDADQMLLDAKAVELATNAYFGSYVGRGYGAGQVTAESIPFMIEMCVNPASAAGTGATSMLTRYALKRFGKQAIKNNAKKYVAAKVGARVVGDLAGSAIMAATTGSVRVAAGTVERMNGDVYVATDDTTGETVYGGHSKGDSFGTALAKSFASTTIENYSEMVGEYFAPVTGVIGKGIRKGMNKIGLKGVNDFIENVAASDVARMVGDFEKHSKWNGVFGEYAEEVAGNMMNALVVGDMTMDTAEGTGVFNLDQNIDTFLGVSLMGGFISGVKTLGYRTPKYRARKNMMSADDNAATLFANPEEWGAIRNTIAFGSDEDVAAKTAEVVGNDDLTEQQKAAALKYIKSVEEYKGILRAEDSRRSENNGTVDVDAETSYDNGYTLDTDEEMNDAKNMYDYKRQQMQELVTEDFLEQFDNDPVGSVAGLLNNDAFTEDEKQLALDYVNAKATYDGMLDRVRDDIDSHVEASNRAVDSHVNTQSGMIHPATLKLNDRKVYVVDGNLLMQEDGSMVDIANSSESILVRDAETGKLEWASPHDFLSIDEEIDPAEEKEAAQAAIREQYAQQKADVIDGVLPFVSGDTYNILDEQGQQHQTQILQDNGDGTVQASFDGAEATTVPKQVIQDMAENANLARLQQFEEQRTIERQQKAAQKAQELYEAQRPVYNLNDEITIRDDAGNLVRGSVTAEENEDGQIEVYTETPINGKKIHMFTRQQIDDMLMEHNGEAVVVPEAPAITAEIDNTGAVQTEASTVQNDVENVPETTENVPAAEETVAVEPMPMAGEGEDAEPDFGATTPQRAHDYIFNESGLEEADAAAFTKNNVEAANKELEKIKNKKPKMGTSIAKFNKDKAEWEKKVNEAQAKADYWKQVKEARDKVLAQRLAEQQERERQQIEQAQADEAAYREEMARKEAEQAALGTNNVSPAIREKWVNAPKVEGAQDEIVLPNGEKVAGRYYLVESGAASASHDSNNGFAKTEGFPVDENGGSVNDRDYERDMDAQQVTRDIANNYDSRAVQTPVVVSQDGVVLSGNGRTMAGELAAAQNTDAAYNSHIAQYPTKWGFTQQQVEGMQHPRVVFVPDAAMPYTAETFAKFNQQEMKGQSKTEQAVKLGKVVSDKASNRIIGIINRFDTLGDFYADSKATSEAIAELQGDGVLSQAQMAEMYDGDGISAIGKELLENTLIGKAFESNPNAVREITEFKSMRQSIITALAEISNSLSLGKDYSLESELAQAIDLVYQARKSGSKFGEPVSWFARQQNLDFFGLGETVADYNNATMLMIADIINDNRSSLLKKYIQSYNHNAQDSANGQLDLFTGGVKSKEDIINEVKQLFNNGSEEEQQKAAQEAVARRKAESVQENGTVANGSEAEPAGEVTETPAVAEGVETPATEEAPTMTREKMLPYMQQFLMETNGDMRLLENMNDEELQKFLGLLDAWEEVNDTLGEAHTANDKYLNDKNKAIAKKAKEAIDAAEQLSSDAFVPVQDYYNELCDKYGITDEEEPAANATGTVAAAIAEAEAATETNPTDAQKEAGNYKKGHVRIDGYDITIENPKGSVRRGTDASGKQWEQEMQNTYGYIRGTEGVDGDHIDVFFSEDPSQGDVFVVDQVNADGSFDEHKVMYGFASEEEARKAYLSNYEEGWHGLGAITHVTKDEFKKWVESSHRKTRPFADYKNVKVEGAQNEEQPMTGSFGPIYTQFKGKSKEAIAFLLEKKDGEAIAALHHKDIGDIDLVWGNEGTGKSDGYGLAKLAKFHPEVLDNLQEILDEMVVTKRSENRVQLESETHQASVRLTWDNEKKNWLLTAFEKKNSVSDNTTDTVGTTEGGKRNDTATPQNTVSDGKVTNNAASDQENGVENGGIEDYVSVADNMEDKHARQQKGSGMGNVSPREAAMRDALVDVLRDSGVEVVTDVEEGQLVLDMANGEARMQAKKRALETASLSEGSDSEVSERSLTVVSSADGAKILKNIDVVIQSLENSPTQPKTFVGDIANALGATRHNSKSEYATFETKNGRVVTIRLADHNATVSNFDNRGELDGISIVVSPKKSAGVTNDGDAHVVEYYYDAIKLRKADGKPLADIVRSIKQALYSGEFEDTTGLAERQEVNADKVRFFRTPDGHAYGFTKDGKIYIDSRIATAETPIHEYSHLWASAFRKANPKEWANIVELMKGTTLWEEVKQRYPELKTDDEIADEVLAQYSGRRGAERLRAEQEKIAKGEGDVFEKAEAISMLDRVRRALVRFWKGVADRFGIRFTTAEEVADKVLSDLLYGVDPVSAMKSKGEGVRYDDNSEDNRDIRYQFVGEKGAAAMDKAEEASVRLDNLAVAREMEAAGKDAKAVKLATGWERGADGKWRYEIEDFDNSGLENLVREDNNKKLRLSEHRRTLLGRKWEMESEVYPDKYFDEFSDAEREQWNREHYAAIAELNDLSKEIDRLKKQENSSDIITDLGVVIGKDHELLKYYPELEGVAVHIIDMPSTVGGNYKLGVITLNRGALHDSSILNHEVQHAIQEIEGFARGGSVSDVRNRIMKRISELDGVSEDAKEMLARQVEYQALASKLGYVYERLMKNGEDWAVRAASDNYWEAMNTLDNDENSALENAYPKGKNASEIAKEGFNREKAIEELKRLSDYYASQISAEDMKNIKGSEAFSGKIDGKSDEELYLALGGEVEARNVQNRLGMTAEERRASLASETEDVAREDQIFLEDGLGVSMSESASETDLENVNGRFNDELGSLTEENKDKVVLSLGRPSDILLAAGVSDKPMKLYGNKVVKKMKKHGFALDELRDLPRAVADPIAVFDNYQLDGNRTVLTELQTKGKNIMVAVTLGKDGVDVDFNIVSSVFGKGENNIVDWLNKGYARYINKEKALDYLHHSDRHISEALSNPRLVSAAKVVENFENPKVVGEKNAADEKDENLYRIVGKRSSYKAKDGSTVTWRSLFSEEEMRGISEEKDGAGLFDPTSVRLRKLEAGETCHVERRYVENGMFDFTGKDKVESADDVAYIFRQLENAAVENSFMVLVKDGKPTVIHLAMGAYTSTMAPFEHAFVAYSKLNPDEVYFVHNHPSGKLKASRQDQESLDRIKKVFGNNVVKSGIIIDTTSGKYGIFDGVNIEQEMPVVQKGAVPIKVYNFGKQVFARDWNPRNAFKITSSDDVASFVSSHRLGEHKKMSLLVLGNDNSVVANLFLPFTRIGNLDNVREVSNLMSDYIHQCGGVSGLLYGNYDYTSDENMLISKISYRMKELGTRLMDVIHVEHSAYNDGLIYEPEASDESLDVVNRRFNDELDKLNEENAQNIIFEIGNPGNILRSAGLSDMPIRLYGNKLIKKMRKHGFDATDVKDLPKAINDPIAVFNNYDNEKNRAVLTELKTSQGNVLVTIEWGKGTDAEINIVTSVFGKGNSKIVDWINKGFATYINKSKALDYLRISAPIAEAQDNRELSDAAKVVENFENPKVSDENVNDDTNLYRIAEEESPVSDYAMSEMVNRVNELAAKLHLDNIEIVTDASTLSGDRRRAKGFYNRKTGKITIVVANHTSLADLEKTVLHESVAHHGLRKLFGEHFNTFLDNVFRNADADVRKRITRLAAKHGWDFRKATEEYLAGLAEDTDFENAKKTGWWEKVKRAFLDMLHKIAFEEYDGDVLTDNELRYILWRSYSNLNENGEHGIINAARNEVMKQKLLANDKPKTETKKKGINQRVMDITDSLLPTSVTYSGEFLSSGAKLPNMLDIQKDLDDNVADDDIFFRDGEDGAEDDRPLSLQESIMQGLMKLAEKNRDNVQFKLDVVRSIGGKLSHLRKAMSAQRKYDRSTVNDITGLARLMMKHGYLGNMTGREVQKLMSIIKDATGKEDTSKAARGLVDMLIDNQVRQAMQLIASVTSVKDSKVNAQGVEVQGRLDQRGQALVKAFRNAMGMTEEQIAERLAEVSDRMDSEDHSISENAATEYAALNLALSYAQDITGSRTEEKSLHQQIADAMEEHKAGQMDSDAYRQFVESTEEAIRQNKLERIEAAHELVAKLAGLLRGSTEAAEAFREREKQRVENIHHYANSDMQGRPADEHHQENWKQKVMNNSFIRFFLKPLATFDQMLRMFGNKNVNGEGYLYNHYMRGWLDANEREFRNFHASCKELDKKVSEVFGRKMRWSDLYSIERKLPKATVSFWNGGAMRDHELTQGNLLYIYMANKMADGKMKLRKMGITDEDMEYIASIIDPRFIELADWLQSEFLVNKRNEYNEVHVRMFGAPMAAIENYFPLKILANARVEEVDVADVTNDKTLPSTTTGSIIKRRRNALALDITGADAFSVIIEHLQQMENWAAFAEFNRDVNTLLSYKRFRNQVQNMSSVYGAGKTLWNNFKDCARIAAGTYHPAVGNDSVDKTLVNVAKGVTSAKIAFRVFTALKQFLSFPAYFAEAAPAKLASSVATPWKSWNWAMKELPSFSKRWKSKQAGDSRLMQTDMDWRFWRNRTVETLSRWGMSPNAFVDALTVAIGARAIYTTKLAAYLKMGYGVEESEKRAKQDASVLFNETQQSNENAFLSTMQLDRSVASVSLSVFRNSSMGYQRQLVDALRTLVRMMKPGYREQSIAFMAKQMVRDGLSEEQAYRAAKRTYGRAVMRNLARISIFGYVMQLAWNLGPYMLYLLTGDDDDDKEEMLEDAAMHALFGGLEGLSAGNVLSELFNMKASGKSLKNYDFDLLPLMGDIQNIVNNFETDKVAAANDIVNLLIQSAAGVNPQTITDAAVAIWDACGGNAKISKEATILIARLLSMPQSQIDKVYVDELGMSGEDASKLSVAEMAERYAKYKKNRGAALTQWSYTDEEEKAVEDKYVQKFETMAKEELSSTGDKELDDAYASYGESYKRMGKMIESVNKERYVDPVAFGQHMGEIASMPEYADYRIYSRFKTYIDRLSSMAMQAKGDEERCEYLDRVVELKKQLVESLDARK